MGDRSGFIARKLENITIEDAVGEIKSKLSIRELWIWKDLIFGVAKSTYPEGVYIDLLGVDSIDNFSILGEDDSGHDYMYLNMSYM